MFCQNSAALVIVNTDNSAYSKQHSVILIIGSQSHLNPRREISLVLEHMITLWQHFCSVISVLLRVFFSIKGMKLSKI